MGTFLRLSGRLEAALPTVPLEIIFVDDGSDGTAELVEDMAAESGRDIVLLRQEHDRRIGGLGGAVVQGLRAARAPWVCVMDADLQHLFELVAALLEQAESRDLDVVVASRYCAEGDAGSFGWTRAMASRSTTTAARLLFPRRLRNVTDPMSGFPGAPRRDRRRPAPSARVQDPARTARPAPGSARGRGFLRLRRAAIRSKQGGV